MTTRRDALLRDAQEATANYNYCRASASDARRALVLGMGSIADVITKTSIENSAHTRWLRAAELFANYR
jgi:hypothetical protein